MPYKSIEEARIKQLNDVPLSLEQANLLAEWADAIAAKGGDVNAWAVATKNFKDTYEVKAGKWVKRTEDHFQADADQEDPDGDVQDLAPEELAAVLKYGLVKDNPDGTVNIMDVPIFQEGTFHGVNSPKQGTTYTGKDIDGMVSNYYALQEELHPPVRMQLKLGHSQDQVLAKQFAAIDGLPNIGGVADPVVRVVKGLKTIFADLMAVPRKLADVIIKNGYRGVSPEIKRLFTSRKSGTQYKNVMLAVALCGAENPAWVTDIPLVKQIINNYTRLESDGDEGAEVYELSVQEDQLVSMAPAEDSPNDEEETIVSFTQEQVDQLLADQKLKHDEAITGLQGKLTAAEANVTAAEDKFTAAEGAHKDAMCGLTERVDALEKSNTELQGANEAARADLKEQVVDKFIADHSTESNMRILPAQKPAIKQMLMAADDQEINKYNLDPADATAETELTPMALMMDTISKGPDHSKVFETQSFNRQGPRADAEEAALEKEATDDMAELGTPRRS